LTKLDEVTLVIGVAEDEEDRDNDMWIFCRILYLLDTYSPKLRRLNLLLDWDATFRAALEVLTIVAQYFRQRPLEELTMSIVNPGHPIPDIEVDAAENDSANASAGDVLEMVAAQELQPTINTSIEYLRFDVLAVQDQSVVREIRRLVSLWTKLNHIDWMLPYAADEVVDPVIDLLLTQFGCDFVTLRDPNADDEETSCTVAHIVQVITDSDFESGVIGIRLPAPTADPLDDDEKKAEDEALISLADDHLFPRLSAIGFCIEADNDIPDNTMVFPEVVRKAFARRIAERETPANIAWQLAAYSIASQVATSGHPLRNSLLQGLPMMVMQFAQEQMIVRPEPPTAATAVAAIEQKKATPSTGNHDVLPGHLQWTMPEDHHVYVHLHRYTEMITDVDRCRFFRSIPMTTRHQQYMHAAAKRRAAAAKRKADELR